MKNVTLVMPVLNEMEGLKLVFPQVDRSLFYEIIAIDGGSTDGTIEYLKKFNVSVIPQDNNDRVPGAMMQALSLVKTKYIIEFSPDNNCLPEDLSKVCEKLNKGYDLVVCSRYLDSAYSDDDTVISGFGNKMFTLMIRLLGKNKITDALTIYRGYDVNKVKSIPKKYIFLGSVFEPLISAWSNLYGWKYTEISSMEPKRIGGKAKVRYVQDGVAITVMIIRLYIRKFFKKCA